MGELFNQNLLETLRKTADAIYAQPEVRRPDDEGSIAGIFAEDGVFNPHMAVTLLLDPKPSYFGHKEAMLAAFSSWVIAPHDEEMQFEFVARSIKSSLKKAEELADQLDENLSPVERDMIARYVIAGPQFIEQIYYPFTGMDLLADAGATETIERVAEGEERRIYTLLRMMDLCHYWSSAHAYKSGLGPSVNRAIDIVERFPDRDTVTRSGIYGQWAKLKSNIALIYAADSLEVGPEQSLLVSIMEGTIDFELHHPVFEQWMRRARFVCETVLSKMPDQGLYESNVSVLADVESEPFPCAEFSVAELHEMEKAAL